MYKSCNFCKQNLQEVPIIVISIFCLHPSLKVELCPSKKKCVICFIECLLKMMKIAVYFILKVRFILKIFKILSWLFGHVEKTAWLEK